MVVDGVELLRMIRNNEIEDGTKIKMYYNYEPIETLILNNNDLKNERTGNSIIDGVEYCIGVFVSDKHEFKILENEETIDIQAIESVNGFKLIEAPYMADCLSKGNFDTFTDFLKQSELEFMNKIDELIKAVKQLDKNKVDK